MINYYYELAEDVKMFGRVTCRYLAQFDVHPGKSGLFNSIWHDEAMKHSTRVWLENANGVSLVKGPMGQLVQERVNEQELVWLKLICKDVESL
jgi:hypothetical protein